MRRSILRITVLVILGLMAFAFVSLALQMAFPAPSGGYAVGHMSMHWADTTRAETVTDDPDDVREVVAEFWYPAEASTGEASPYFSNLGHLGSGLAASGEVDPIEVFGLRFVRSETRLNAAPDRSGARYPVVIFSPGNGTNVEFYQGVETELASHGYIVVGINHPYDVAAVELLDGRIAVFPADQIPFEIQANAAYVADRIAVRTADIVFALDQLERLYAEPNNPFAGQLDLAHVGVMGHSLGGITAMQTCLADGRFKACANLDGLQAGGPFSAERDFTPPLQPFMLLTKETDLGELITRSFVEAANRSYQVVIPGAHHTDFSDTGVLLPSLLPVPGQADRIMELTRQYTLAFFDTTLKGQSGDLLNTSYQNAEVSVTVYG
ncbi:MAG: hypothetical protein KJ065_22795 [Anaerolineae bacterium]|nr:hypothetical protein [Anaerolineae bacterium]